MSWTVILHRDIENDLQRIGAAAAKRILRTINSKLTQAPLQFGVPLSGNLSAFRKLRIGDYRVVYQATESTVTVFVLAVGPRRDKEVCDLAALRC